MINQVRSAIRKHRILSGGEHVLLAVSGGSDSVGMLRVFMDLAPSLRLRLTVAHLHHGIRKDSADADAEFVKKLAARWKLCCIVERTDVPRLAGRQGISLEMAAREARYAFLSRVARRVGADAVATAHTLDDQAETVVLKLARGAGTGGLGGIARCAMRHGVRLVRPMLDVGREDIRTYLRKRGIPWREDESNRDTSILRNRVRHRILPVLEAELSPRIKRALARTADVLQEEELWLAELTRSLLESCGGTPGKTAGAARRTAPSSLSVDALSRQPAAARRRVIRLWLALSGVPPERLDFDATGRIESLAVRRKGSGRTEVAGRWIVERCYDRLSVRSARGRASGDPAKPFRKPVRVAGRTDLPDIGLRIVTEVKPGLVRGKTGQVGMLPATATIRRSAVGRRRLLVRSWRPGDKMNPLGMSGSRKLQDIFTDGKVPAERRLRVPLFECGGEIVWIPGYRVARGWEVTHPPHDAVHISIERL